MMTDDQQQKITWELSLDDRDVFQPVEPGSPTAEKLSFRPVDPPWPLQLVSVPGRWRKTSLGGRGDWDQAKWNELIRKPHV
ncbi:MAG: hypothetical protein Ct9H300mP1_12710 [Planctomycetaceae bacterium]|nr:MAG: hypothetical protein Ct9H300mP1_12710 [Planctomycetaceae bacterium]